MPSKVSFKGVATKVRKAILKSKKKVSLTPQQLKLLRQSHKPPRMSDDEKRIIREQGREGMEFCAERVEWLRSPLVQTGRYAPSSQPRHLELHSSKHRLAQHTPGFPEAGSIP